MKIFIKFILIFFVISLLIYLWLVFFPKNFLEKKILFRIEKGQGLSDVAYDLEKNNLIRNKNIFIFHSLILGKSKKMIAGDYLLSSSQSIAEISDIISGGAVFRDEVKITFPEGFSLAEIENRLADQGFNIDLKSKKAFQYKSFYNFLNSVPDNATLEGFLFPDTYIFDKKFTDDEIIIKFLSNFNKKLDKTLTDKIELQKKNIFQIVTMASLIEKEIKTLEDKKIVSGILWKRLSINMPLQVDATIAYLAGKKTTKLTLEDLKIKSSYNTYLNRGLPPGPISNPGLDSIIAAIEPEISDYLYYLSASEDGRTIFSKTYTEHLKAKNIYLK